MLTYVLDEKKKAGKAAESQGDDSFYGAGYREKKLLYQQIYEKIRSDIVTGRIAPGSRLPSKRNLARQLSVSVITVETAYAKLVDEGYVTASAKRGFFVAALSVDARLLQAEKAEARLPAATPRSVQEPAQKATAETEAEGESPQELQLFPFATWSRLLRRVLSEEKEACMQPSPAQGSYRLREAIARHLYGFRGLSVLPEQIVVGAGSEYLYSLIMQLLGFDNVFALENPGYGKIRRIYQACGASSLFLPMDEEGISMEALRKSRANIVHISPSHHFPTGRTTTISRRYELLSWAAQGERRYIIEDDYDGEFRLTGRIIPTLSSIDTLDRVIYLNTFTKTLSPSLRISYMVLPRSLLEDFSRKLGFYANTVPTLHQLVLSHFMEEGHFESHIHRLRRFYREKRDTALSLLAAFPALSAGTVKEADAGVYFLLELATKKSGRELRLAAARESLELDLLSDYYSAEESFLQAEEEQQLEAARRTIIVQYAGLSQSQLQEYFSSLSRALES